MLDTKETQVGDQDVAARVELVAAQQTQAEHDLAALAEAVEVVLIHLTKFHPSHDVVESIKMAEALGVVATVKRIHPRSGDGTAT